MDSPCKVVHCKKEPYDVYIGRPSKWGNPYTHLKDKTTKAEFIVDTREEAIKKYEEYLLNNPELISSIPELYGKTLGCWCSPKSCHGDVLVKWVELFQFAEKEFRIAIDEYFKDLKKDEKKMRDFLFKSISAGCQV